MSLVSIKIKSLIVFEPYISIGKNVNQEEIKVLKNGYSGQLQLGN